jgi:hypothetical protein
MLLVVSLMSGYSSPPIAESQVPLSTLQDGSYELLTERAKAHRDSFFLYADADSGLNHGFPSGVFGNPPNIQINAHCIDDPSSGSGCTSDPNRLDRVRGSVLNLVFGPRSPGQFHGVNIEEPQNWGATQNGVGYDLRGATQMSLDARSPQGIRVQFSVGGSTAPFVTIPTTWTPITIQLSSLAPTPPDLTNVHLLLGVATNDANAPSGGSLLIDNIRFEPVPSRQASTLGLPVSTKTFGIMPADISPIPTDQVNPNPAAIYEAALTIQTLLDRGTSSDLANARLVADALSYALHHDNSGNPIPPSPDGSTGLHSAYESGEIALLNGQGPGAGQAGQVRLAGFSVPSTTLCGPTKFCLVLDGATGGNNAFAILALVEASRRLNEPRYLDDALTIGGWIEQNLRAAGGFGGYVLGYPDGVVPKSRLEGKSIENNADIFAAFTALAWAERNRGNAAAAALWTTRAEWAGDFVMLLFDSASGRFYAGTVPVGTSPAPGICPDPSRQMGNEILNVCDFIDANTFVILAMAGAPRYRQQIDWRRPIQYARTAFAKSIAANGRTYMGFNLVTTPSSGPDGVAWEFTGQMILAMRYVDFLTGQRTFATDVATYMAQLRQAQTLSPFGDGRGLVAATMQGGDTLPPSQHCIVTPFQCIPARVGIAATTWAIFAERCTNPLSGARVQPNVELNVAPSGPNTLAVTVTAGWGTIERVRGIPGKSTNVLVDIEGQVNRLPSFDVVPNGSPSALTMTLHRAVNSGSGTLSFIVTDGCGDWETLAGGGDGAWPASGGAPAVGASAIATTTVGARSTVTPPPSTPPTPGAACASFASHAEAQAYLRKNPSDSLLLDRNRNGIACEGADGAGFVNPPLDHTPVPRP